MDLVLNHRRRRLLKPLLALWLGLRLQLVLRQVHLVELLGGSLVLLVLNREYFLIVVDKLLVDLVLLLPTLLLVEVSLLLLMLLLAALGCSLSSSDHDLGDGGLELLSGQRACLGVLSPLVHGRGGGLIRLQVLLVQLRVHGRPVLLGLGLQALVVG